MEIRLPDFLIVGAAKSGTTSLFMYLGEHPQIYMPKIKEPYFFCFWNKVISFKTDANIINTLDAYVSLFKGAEDDHLTGEATPYYLYFYKESIYNIKKLYNTFCKDYPKILIILRNPIERAFSQYLMHVRDGKESLSFEKAIQDSTIKYRLKNGWNPGYDYIGFGRYYEQVEAYMSNFKEVKILLYEDLKENTLETIQEIYSFLNVDPSYNPSSINTRYNVSGIPRNRFLYDLINKPSFLKEIVKYVLPQKFLWNLKAQVNNLLLSKDMEISEKAKEYLRNIYYSDILKLQELIKRDLSHWLE